MKRYTLFAFIALTCLLYFVNCDKSTSTDRNLEQSAVITEEQKVENKSPEKSKKTAEPTVEEEPLLNISKLDFKSKIIDTLKYNDGKYQNNPSVFYILGFSKDGKILYGENRAVDGRGGNDIFLAIQDLVSDDMLWDFKESIEDTADVSFEKTVKDNLEKINAEIKKYKILDADYSFNFPPIEANGKKIEFEMDVKNTGEKEFDWLDIIEYKLKAKSDSKEKIIARSKVTAFDAFTCGYVKSPYENRAAVIIATDKYTFEQTEPFFTIAGCSLEEGF